jgi:16S rRNA (cytosine967-C5)-methyltransferase
LVGHIINPQEGEKILDICAAPGGKTTHLAQLSNDNASIIALELHEHRCKLIRELCNRLGINSIGVEQKDATIFDENLTEKFDKIIVDVPCSGLGVIRKKPDIKWNTTEEDVNNLTDVQYKILLNASKYLKVGGSLVYSTCTNVYDENEGVINKFLAENNQFKIAKIDNIPEEFAQYVYNEGMLDLSPDKNGCDGFFICKLLKQRHLQINEKMVK